MVNLICLTGQSGSGKTSLINLLFQKYADMVLLYNIRPLIYCTTRPMRKGEIDGIDYIFLSNNDYNKIDKDLIIEDRLYHTVDNGDTHYFTTKNNIKDGINYICNCSPSQYLNYKKYIEENNIDNIKLHLYYIDAPYQVIFDRIFLNRLSGDTRKDNKIILEACRRLVTDAPDFESIEQYIDKRIDNNSSIDIVVSNLACNIRDSINDEI